MASFHLLCVGDDNCQDGDMDDGDCVVVYDKIPKRRRQELDQNRQVFSEGGAAERAPVQRVPWQQVLQEGLSVFVPQQELQNKQNRQVFSEGGAAERAPVQRVPWQQVLQEGLSVFVPQQELQNKQNRQVFSEGGAAERAPVQRVPWQQVLQEGLSVFVPQQELQNKQNRQVFSEGGAAERAPVQRVPWQQVLQEGLSVFVPQQELQNKQNRQVFSEGGAAERAPVQRVPLQQVLQEGLSVFVPQQELQNKQNRQVFSEGGAAERAPVQRVPLQQVLQEGLSVFVPQQELQNKQNRQVFSEGGAAERAPVQRVPLQQVLQEGLLVFVPQQELQNKQNRQVFSEGGAAERAPVQRVPLQQVLQEGLSVFVPQQELQNKQNRQVFSEGGAAERAPVQRVPLQQVLQEGLSVFVPQQELQNKLHDTTYQKTSQVPQQPSGHNGESAMRQVQQLTKLMEIVHEMLAPLLPKVMQQQCQEDSGNAEFTLSSMNTDVQNSNVIQNPHGLSVSGFTGGSAEKDVVSPGNVIIEESHLPPLGILNHPPVAVRDTVTIMNDRRDPRSPERVQDITSQNNQLSEEQNSNMIQNPDDPSVSGFTGGSAEKDVVPLENVITEESHLPPLGILNHPPVAVRDTVTIMNDRRDPRSPERVQDITSQNNQLSEEQNSNMIQNPDDPSVSGFTGGSAEKDVVPLENVITEESHLPPLGILNHPPVAVGDSVYVMNDIRDPWALGRVQDIRSQNNQTMYTVEYVYYKNKKMKRKTKETTGFQLAYPKVQVFRFPVGHRIISIFRDRNYEGYYSGVIAETPKSINQYRYLIFFDNGSTQYVKHGDIRLVVDCSQSVLEDVPIENREFVQNYLEKYPERAMLKVQEGQYVSTEWNGVWYNAKVVQVDASLVQIAYPPKWKYVEWIYRGSPRLHPLFEARERTCRKRFARTKAFARKISNPFIQYTVKEEEELDRGMKGEHETAQELERSCNSRARMNTSSQLTAQYLRLSSTVEPLKKKFYPCYSQGTYKPHTCNPSCMVAVSSIQDNSSYRNLSSHLSEPLLYGWTREEVKHSDCVSVYYRAPCKLRLRNIEEVHKYLLKTKSKLTVDQFDFNHCVRCLSEDVNEECFTKIEDISNGIEAVPIPCINTIDTREPDQFTYVNKYVPPSGTNTETDPEFLTCCDCTDDCLDKEKCDCWRQTMAGVKYGQEKGSPSKQGYYYKRLFERLVTGIYECNSRCKCSSTCLNRLVQLPIKCKTQVFMTPDRGWGVRTLHDVPKGSFICLYAGRVLSEEVGNIVSVDDGDEYQVDLDYIEDAERLKENYEENPYENELEDVCRKRSSSKRKVKTETSRKLTGKMYKIVAPSTRVLFGRNGRYILDAKSSGNVGRFLNHSCNPNLFVQNVFVNTHDLRFPYVAFFTNSFVPANTELTWNYGYDVGSVTDRVIICKCGETNCQGRLL